MWNTTVRNGNGTWVNIRIRGTYHTTRNTSPIWHINREALAEEMKKIRGECASQSTPHTENRG